jgi:hypothetical protein
MFIAAARTSKSHFFLLRPIYLYVLVFNISPPPPEMKHYSFTSCALMIQACNFVSNAHISIGLPGVTYQMTATFPPPFLHYMFLSSYFYISFHFSLLPASLLFFCFVFCFLFFVFVFFFFFFFFTSLCSASCLPFLLFSCLFILYEFLKSPPPPDPPEPQTQTRPTRSGPHHAPARDLNAYSTQLPISIQ